MNNIYDIAFNFILEVEGREFTDDPRDSGGATKMGVTQERYDEWLESMGEMPRTVRLITESEAKIIYNKYYWTKKGCDKIAEFNPKLAIYYFQYVVNCGSNLIPRRLQRIVGVKDDGIIGPKTIQAVKNYVGNLINVLVDSQKNHYANLIAKRPKDKAFENGWANRIRDTLKLLSTL